MHAGHDDRTEGRQSCCALSAPELTDLPAPAETLPAATGCRVEPRPAPGALTHGVPAEAGR